MSQHNISVTEKLSWFIRHLNCPMGFIYSIQFCEISHQTFGPSHLKCPTCPMVFVNTDSMNLRLQCYECVI